VVDVLTSESNKGQEENISVNAKEGRPFQRRGTFTPFVQNQLEWNDDIVLLNTTDNALHDAVQINVHTVRYISN